MGHTFVVHCLVSNHNNLVLSHKGGMCWLIGSLYVQVLEAKSVLANTQNGNGAECRVQTDKPAAERDITITTQSFPVYSTPGKLQPPASVKLPTRKPLVTPQTTAPTPKDPDSSSGQSGQSDLLDFDNWSETESNGKRRCSPIHTFWSPAASLYR